VAAGARVFLAGLVGCCLFSADAGAFGTVNLLGQRAEHERLTRFALRSRGLGPHTMDQLAGRAGSFGAVGAPDRPGRGLLSTSEAHCDNGDFLPLAGYPRTAQAAQAQLAGCRTWMVNELRAAVRSAGRLLTAAGAPAMDQASLASGCRFDGKPDLAKCETLEHIGVALHAAQDFYSHSNWTDAAGGSASGDPPGLGHSSRAPWLDPRGSVAFPAGLMTGCYEGIPESLHCKYGDGQVRVRHAALNKDKGDIDPASGPSGPGRTDRGRVQMNFERAVRAAAEDTDDKWAFFQEGVLAAYGRQRGGMIICMMRQDTPAGCG
jgi:hypothetical protein